MRYLNLLLLFTLSLSASASEFASSKQLKTFFTTSSTRDTLDQQRASGMYQKHKNTSSSVALFREPTVVKMKGVVLRKDQKPVVFVNEGNTLKSRQIDEDISVRRGKIKLPSYKVPLSVNQQAIRMKPGQQWSESKPAVTDNYQINESKDEPDGDSTAKK